jgi:Fe-S-cluster containining protein
MNDTTDKLIPRKLETLAKIYTRHDDLMEKLDLACRAGCDLCCTRNVAVTSLEADLVVRHLEETGGRKLLEKIEASKNLPRFQPLTTTNTLAHLCRNGQPPPEEKCDPAWRPCPFLTKSRCSIYAVRPFACRCMVSKSICREGGQAEIDDYLLALHTVFMQFIEHTDASGCTGNLIDMLMAPLTGGQPEQSGFIPNRSIEMILMPPEFQNRARPILEKLGALFNS